MLVAFCRQAAKRFGVSAASAIRWQALRRRQGHAQPMGAIRRTIYNREVILCASLPSAEQGRGRRIVVSTGLALYCRMPLA
jgi:hypothetical protein